jgi:biotin transport system substrate-specific component
MLTQKNKLNSNKNLKHPLLAGAFLLLVILGSKIDLNFGGLVSFTLQTLFLGLAYYFLPFQWRLVLIVTYLLLGIAGVPVFNGGVGWEYFSSGPFGFFVGFILAGFLKPTEKSNFGLLFFYFIQIHIVIVFVGILWMGFYIGSIPNALTMAVDLQMGVALKSLAGAGLVWGILKFGVLFIDKSHIE